MRDFAAKWTAFPDWQDARIAREGWQAHVVTGLSQVMVSGHLEKAWKALPDSGNEVGLWQVASTDSSYRVRIARDRALLVSPDPIDFEAGWQPEGWAATPAHDALLVIEIQGMPAEEIVMEATSVNLDEGSPSASVRFAGLNGVLLYRTAPNCARLHVEASYGPYLWRWLESRKA
ncbi:hypothetical protein [Fodinicurvata sediminis]|uniref:hypothetical protein n=1 Tax=Fodinicurvata sediminis TaxID=1121832 RepID=UPI0003B68B5D|nr:hypothetical protein [Fodinicurvata sediminis]